MIDLGETAVGRGIGALRTFLERVHHRFRARRGIDGEHGSIAMLARDAAAIRSRPVQQAVDADQIRRWKLTVLAACEGVNDCLLTGCGLQ